MKGFRQNIIDFEIIPTGNPRTMVFVDSSNYIEEPDKPLLEILMPGYNKFLLANVVARQVNTFNSNTLGYTELLNSDILLDLPDGLYKLKYKVCPYTANYKAKNIFRTDLLEQKIKVIYSKIEVTPPAKKDTPVIENDLSQIHILIAGCHSIADVDERKATEFYAVAYKLAEKLIKTLEKCCN